MYIKFGYLSYIVYIIAKLSGNIIQVYPAISHNTLSVTSFESKLADVNNEVVLV